MFLYKKFENFPAKNFDHYFCLQVENIKSLTAHPLLAENQLIKTL
jgi:hypothetical protein